MQLKLVSLNAFNFHEVVTLIWNTVNGESSSSYKRAKAEQYAKDNSNNIIVLEVNDEVMGMYGFFDSPNSYSLSFFALDKRVRKTRAGYSLFSDLKHRLVSKPVIVPVYNDNTIMSNIVKKRGVFIGRFKTEGNRILDYYSISFQNED